MGDRGGFGDAMMKSAGVGLLLAGLLLAAAGPGDACQEARDLPTRFAEALKKLGSDDFEEREAATAEISGLPVDAIPLVESTLSQPTLDPELRTRLDRAIVKLREKKRLASASARTAQDREWSKRTTRDAYETAGRKDPRWDEKARETLDLMSVIWSDRRSTDRDERERAYALTQELTALGCDDPLILTAHAQMHDNFYTKDLQRSIPLHVAAARSMKEKGGKYAALQQALVFAHAALKRPRVTGGLSEDDRKETQEWLDLAQERFAAAAKEADVPEEALLSCGKLLVRAWTVFGNDRKVGFERVSGALGQARPASTLPLLLKGRVYVDYAWDARGNGFANTVSPEKAKLMEDRLAEAETALLQAWEKRPDDPMVATLMIDVELGQGKGREVMETWYRRAMAADPDNVAACRAKMYYLEPKWYGDAKEMLDFGRQLLAGGNWEARLPILLVDAHVKLAGYEQDRGAYYRDDAVWRDVQAVYAGYLGKHPDSDFDRSRFAKLACWCGKYDEARKQFNQLGDRVVVAAFTSRAQLTQLKAQAEEKGR